MENLKVSIITPLYNSDKFINETIKSVIAQTYKDWEMLIVDDCSTDNSRLIVEKFCNIDSRIKYLRTIFPSGSPTIPRNMGVDMAEGRFIAFLDSDDLWEENKLENQLKLFDDESIAIVYSNYEKINEEGESSNRIIIAPDYVDYNKLLKGNVIACCTCVYDSKKTGKLYFNEQGHEDYVLWLKILKKGFIAINSGYVSAKYRIRRSSVSSNKIRAVGWVYNIYRLNEKLSIIKSIYCTILSASKSFFKYIK